MNTWKNLPEVHHLKNGFTSVELPEEIVRDQLETLPSVKQIEIAKELKSLKAQVRADSKNTNLRIRKDQIDFNQPLKSAFKKAVEKLVEEGSYTQLVLIHSDMSHNMHGSMGKTGLLRFLGWHRQYLMQFEELLIAADRDLRPTASERLTLPFWKWNDPFPDWLIDFLPAKHPANSTTLPSRKNSQPPEKPNSIDIDLILNEFRNQLPNTVFADPNVAEYTRFTYALEGWDRRLDSTSLPAHNHVHDWVGGIMSNPQYSPADPIFWLHHAEVDRLWSIWQNKYTNAHPPLSGADRVFDPWVATYDTVKLIEGMGYTYNSS